MEPHPRRWADLEHVESCPSLTFLDCGGENEEEPPAARIPARPAGCGESPVCGPMLSLKARSGLGQPCGSKRGTLNKTFFFCINSFIRQINAYCPQDLIRTGIKNAPYCKFQNSLVVFMCQVFDLNIHTSPVRYRGCAGPLLRCRN